MVKKVLLIIGLCLLGGYLIFAVFFFDKEPKEQVCGRFEIIISDDTDEKFVEAADLAKFIDQKGLNPYGKQMKDINTYEIQEALLSNKLIKSAEVFVTNNGGIKAVIKERIPVLRIIPSQGESYYIDKEAEKMPLSNLNTAYIPVVTGNVKEEFAKTELYSFALFLQKNKFWNAQIEQIVVQNENDIILITRLGNHEVILGGLDNYESKLNRLKTFYTKVLPETGWNRYSKINLKYDKQVVGTKR